MIKHLGKSYGLDTERGKWLEASAGEADGGGQAGGSAEVIYLVFA